jgi:hypothetical protein
LLLLLLTGYARRSHLSTPSSPSALVAGAGSAVVNGLYTERGTEGGKPYYNLEDQPDDFTTSAVVWSTGSWQIIDDRGANSYVGVESTDFPWEVSTWNTGSGDEPPPTVTEA